MGVTGLWKLIEPCGQPIPVEMLENKVLAVDISIWLHQAVKGFQDNRGSALANSHLLGLFHRLCKLMYYRIKPVFVFDGKVPMLKKETIAKRSQRRNKLLNEADRVQTLLLQSLAKEKVVQQALGSKAAAELLKSSPSKNNMKKRPDIDDMFKLPDLPPIKETSEESDFNTTAETTCSSDTDSSFDESKPRHHYNQNLQAIDVKSKYFRNLPADIRHEILIDIKETRKQSSWGKLHELPSKSNEFSTFQMKRLLRRRQVQECLEEAEKEMDGVRTFTLSELESIFSEEGIIEPSALPNTKHISSDANTRFLLVRDLKKTLATAIAESEEVEVKPETSASAIAKDEELKEEKSTDLGDEYEDDLQKAIQMSLDESAVYSESDYEYKGSLKLSKEQRKHLKNTAVGLARAYMIEHAGMNDEDVQGLLEHTQALSDDDEFNVTSGVHNEKESTENNEGTTACPVSDINNQATPKEENTNLSSAKTLTIENQLATNQKEAEDVGIMSDSNSDSELEEVCDNKSANKNLEIFVDASKAINQEDDLFADIFPSTEEKKLEVKPSSSNAAEILAAIKKQVSEVSKINLNDIKLDPSIIEISDDESIRLSQNLIYETDSDALSQSESSVTKMTEVVKSSDEGDIQSKDSLVDKLNLEKQSCTTNNEQSTSSKTLDEAKILSKDSLVDKEIPEDLKSESTGLNLKDAPLKPETMEIIEIIDDQMPTNILPTQTPPKKKAISEFFETKYVIKRTPEKAAESAEDVPKVKSPFFVKKTPKSGSGKKRNATDDEASPAKKPNKAAKMLFEQSNDDIEMIPLKEETDEPNNLEATANALRENKSREELETLASSLAKEKKDLEMERNRQDRMGMTITERMSTECMELLRLFGVPFIAAPMEAEAQCAFLDAMHLTNGTITDDSDIWLFGGQTVYKNFFAQNKHVMEFKSDKIENAFNVDRAKLIQLALLVGSDYTTGINGIGAVTALEILATFSINPAKDAVTSQQTTTVLATLRNFRDWWAASIKSSLAIGNPTRHRLRNKLKNIELSEGFPNPAVVEAYLAPTIDNSQESFSWGSPDVPSIIEFTRKNFGWTRLKTDEILGPVLKKLNEKRTQATIKNYFAVKSAISVKQIPKSKRVQNAVNKLSADYKPEEEDEAKTAAKPKRGKRKQPTQPTSTSEDVPKKTTRVSKKKISPQATSVEIIPQRQKDIDEMERKKELAAAVLRKSKPTAKK